MVAWLRTLVRIAHRVRNLKGHGLEEGASTRMLINAGLLTKRGIPIEEACVFAPVLPITDDLDMRDALKAAVAACVDGHGAADGASAVPA